MHFNEAADMYSIWPKMNMKFWNLYISDIFIADFLHELLINISLYLTIRCLSKIIFSHFMIKYLFFLSILIIEENNAMQYNDDWEINIPQKYQNADVKFRFSPVSVHLKLLLTISFFFTRTL